MNKNIMVLGGSGFLGTNICNKLIQEYNVFSVDYIKSERLNEKVEQYSCSLKQTDELTDILVKKRIKCVIHCVSSLIPKSDRMQFIKDVEDIYIGTVNLLEICSQNGIKVVFLSSGGTVYNNSIEKHKENDVLKPLSFYGISKLGLEELIQFYHTKYNLKYLILRPSNPYGIGQKTDGRQGLIATLLGKVLRNEVFRIWGDGSDIRDYIYIDDFTYIINSLLKKNVSNTIINIGSGDGVSILDVVRTTERIIGKNIELEYVKNSALPVKSNVLDISYLLSLIDYNPTNLEQGITLFYNNLKQNNNG